MLAPPALLLTLPATRNPQFVTLKRRNLIGAGIKGFRLQRAAHNMAAHVQRALALLACLLLHQIAGGWLYGEAHLQPASPLSPLPLPPLGAPAPSGMSGGARLQRSHALPYASVLRAGSTVAALPSALPRRQLIALPAIPSWVKMTQPQRPRAQREYEVRARCAPCSTSTAPTRAAASVAAVTARCWRFWCPLACLQDNVKEVAAANKAGKRYDLVLYGDSTTSRQMGIGQSPGWAKYFGAPLRASPFGMIGSNLQVMPVGAGQAVLG